MNQACQRPSRRQQVLAGARLEMNPNEGSFGAVCGLAASQASSSSSIKRSHD